MYVLIPSNKDTSQIELGPAPVASFNLNYLFKDLISKQGYILQYKGLGPF